MRGDPRGDREGRRTPAALTLYALLWQTLVPGPRAVTVGRVTALAWPPQLPLATLLAEAADGTPAFPGIGPMPGERPIRLVLAGTRARFDSITRGRLPPWSQGAAFPDAGAIVVLARGAPDELRTAVRHELAHLALRWTLRRPAPLWLEEGYAAVAAGEWGRLDALRLNVALATGRRPGLDEVDRALRGSQADAGPAYALATTAVLLLERWGGTTGLERLFGAMRDGASFDDALRRTYYLTEGDFEERWRKDVGVRYGWLAGATAAAFAWGVMGIVVVALVLLRRRRDRDRRHKLDSEPTPFSGEDTTAPEPPTA